MQHTTPKPPSIRELMPSGFIKLLAQRTGCKHPGTLSTVVNLEDTGSRHWSAVEQLARETDPERFAQWQAAQEQPTAALTA